MALEHATSALGGATLHFMLIYDHEFSAYLFFAERRFRKAYCCVRSHIFETGRRAGDQGIDWSSKPIA
jgi:hypothetical protein